MAPRETENNAYAKFWDDKQIALWCVMVFSGVVNCIDGLLIEKDNIILTTCIKKNRKVLAKDKVECVLKRRLLITKV